MAAMNEIITEARDVLHEDAVNKLDEELRQIRKHKRSINFRGDDWMGEE